jgi:hypothetical protein
MIEALHRQKRPLMTSYPKMCTRPAARQRLLCRSIMRTVEEGSNVAAEWGRNA